jgi:hypothetical protein
VTPPPHPSSFSSLLTRHGRLSNDPVSDHLLLSPIPALEISSGLVIFPTSPHPLCLPSQGVISLRDAVETFHVDLVQPLSKQDQGVSELLSSFPSSSLPQLLLMAYGTERNDIDIQTLLQDLGHLCLLFFLTHLQDIGIQGHRRESLWRTKVQTTISMLSCRFSSVRQLSETLHPFVETKETNSA